MNMQIYKNLGGNSNLQAFEVGSDYIDVVFYGTAETYRYSYASAGKENVERAKQLALAGSGLNSYIMRYMRLLYEK